METIEILSDDDRHISAISGAIQDFINSGAIQDFIASGVLERLDGFLRINFSTGYAELSVSAYQPVNPRIEGKTFYLAPGSTNARQPDTCTARISAERTSQKPPRGPGV